AVGAGAAERHLPGVVEGDREVPLAPPPAKRSQILHPMDTVPEEDVLAPIERIAADTRHLTAGIDGIRVAPPASQVADVGHGGPIIEVRVGGALAGLGAADHLTRSVDKASAAEFAAQRSQVMDVLPAIEEGVLVEAYHQLVADHFAVPVEARCPAV